MMQWSLRRGAMVPLIAALMVTTLACGDDGGDDNTNTPNNEPNNAPNNEPNNAPNNAPNNEPNNTPNNDGPLDERVPDGEYLMGIAVGPLDGLVLPFRITVDGTSMDDGSGTFTSMAIRAIAGDGTESDVVGTATDVAIDADGNFEASFPGMMLDGEFSPTGGPVTISPVFTGAIVGTESFCGEVGGVIDTFDILLDGSTFGAIRFEDGDLANAPGTCPGDAVAEIPRIAVEDCPTVTVGRNTDFPSTPEAGGRIFELFAPTDIGPDETLPLIFVFHGFGGDIASMTNNANFPELAQDMRLLIAVPQGRPGGGFDSLFNVVARESNDIAFFDDILTCVSNDFPVDEDRVHSTGMSNGGLMTGTLVATRGDKLASIAPMSGGIFPAIGYPEDLENNMPGLIIWGGPRDIAFDQNFNDLSLNLIQDFTDNGHFTIACDHGPTREDEDDTHAFSTDYWPWIFQFLKDHPRGAETPYTDGVPTDIFPDFCTIP